MWLVGALCIVVRSGANVMDGLVAERSGRVTPVGRLYNEAPDRVSDIAMLAGLGYATGSWEAGGWIAAAAALMVAYVRAAAADAGAPQDYGGPMAKPHRMALLTVAALAQAAWYFFDDSPPAILFWALVVMAAGCLVTIFRRCVLIMRELNAK